MDSSGGTEQDTWWVACLCAAWCGVCREWQSTFSAQARANPHMRFAWVDVEDEDETMGEVDIATFPTLLVARGDEVLYLAPIPPFTKQFTRLIERLEAQPRPDPGVPADSNALLARLRGEVLPRTLV